MVDSGESTTSVYYCSQLPHDAISPVVLNFRSRDHKRLQGGGRGGKFDVGHRPSTWPSELFANKAPTIFRYQTFQIIRSYPTSNTLPRAVFS